MCTENFNVALKKKINLSKKKYVLEFLFCKEEIGTSVSMIYHHLVVTEGRT